MTLQTLKDSATILFPNMAKYLTMSNYVENLMAHLESCKDICDGFGANTVVLPVQTQPNKVDGFEIKSYRNPNSVSFNDVDDANNLRFAADPFWDDAEEWDFGGVDEVVESNLPPVDSSVPDDGKIVEVSKRWVDRMMADLALCPFTKSSTQSGIPMGPVRYHIDRLSTMEDAYAAFWKEVCVIEDVKGAEISTTLQILPEFCMSSIELFEQWSDTLTSTLEQLNVEETLQLIFFHPNWTFRDGGERSGAAAANYARRSPWPMVNLLRTDQVRTAQKGIPTGLVYQQNEKILGEIGTEELERMLRLRDWEGVAGKKVDRRDMEALRVADDLQVTGVVKEQDTSFMYDSTPKANKVDKAQIETGNMVKVIEQALEMRLSAGSLDGGKTSATLMASDFLIEELDRVSREGPTAPSASGNVVDVRYRAALSDIEDDLRGDSEEGVEDAEMAALWGGGIAMTSGDD